MHRSSSFNLRDFFIFSADETIFEWRIGTIFGRDVVPEVCRIKATFVGLGTRSDVTGSLISQWSSNSPAECFELTLILTTKIFN